MKWFQYIPWKVALIFGVVGVLLYIDREQRLCKPRPTRIQEMHVSPMADTELDIDVKQIHDFAIALRFCPPGKIETVELDVAHVGGHPSMIITTSNDDGERTRTRLPMRQLIVEESRDGIVVLKRLPERNEMLF